MVVSLERELDEEEDEDNQVFGKVYAPNYPKVDAVCIQQHQKYKCYSIIEFKLYA